jgi:hypothetical protein
VANFLACLVIVSFLISGDVQYQPFLEGDNRRNQRRSCLSIEKLRNITEEGNSVHANIGNATSKISRILAQAESWYEQHKALLVR